uniref:Uncharacterized protein n=1 Tax=Knipowitschia caucasica TaxID=637954 RepID=A0AAV2JNQ3_KNICA
MVVTWGEEEELCPQRQSQAKGVHCCRLPLALTLFLLPGAKLGSSPGFHFVTEEHSQELGPRREQAAGPNDESKCRRLPPAHTSLLEALKCQPTCL